MEKITDKEREEIKEKFRNCVEELYLSGNLKPNEIMQILLSFCVAEQWRLAKCQGTLGV
ncbi:hypothetical protein CAG63_18430 [Vibrio sp. V37_P2S8PM304]|uniref:hypothetical protein n=1 Tax=Vibrio sp. V37_P2S8PM304 TaxID=1938688 RepID=UPI0013731FF3|nr:hypothetical protein [Vibrio sp. V37_P2S8PM304]NAX32025.1 hypothetical protein [Vibrio sp. V37_P2S8PM304]